MCCCSSSQKKHVLLSFLLNLWSNLKEISLSFLAIPHLLSINLFQLIAHGRVKVSFWHKTLIFLLLFLWYQENTQPTIYSTWIWQRDKLKKSENTCWNSVQSQTREFELKESDYWTHIQQVATNTTPNEG